MNKGFLIVLLAGIGAYLLYKNKQEASQITGTDYMPNDNRPRGERLNNPMNIEKSSNKWFGLSLEQPDTRFASFQLPEYGIRAWVKIINTYYYKYNLKTIKGIVNRFAPASENDTLSYIKSVSKETGIPYDVPFTFTRDNLVKLATAFIRHEQGRVSYPILVIQNGVKMGMGL